MLSAALIYLVNIVFGLFIVALLLRFYLQWVRAPFRNPLSEFVQALTDFMVRPVRRLIPGLWGLDLATFALAWFAQFLEILIVIQIRGTLPGPEAGMVVAAAALMALVMLAKVGLYIVMIAVLAQALLSLMGFHGPMTPVLNSMTRPFLRVFQRRIPPVGNVDLSPLFVLVIVQLLLMVPIVWLESAIGQLFR